MPLSPSAKLLPAGVDNVLAYRPLGVACDCASVGGGDTASGGPLLT